jgi:hypothetical protein
MASDWKSSVQRLRFRVSSSLYPSTASDSPSWMLTLRSSGLALSNFSLIVLPSSDMIDGFSLGSKLQDCSRRLDSTPVVMLVPT